MTDRGMLVTLTRGSVHGVSYFPRRLELASWSVLSFGEGVFVCLVNVCRFRGLHFLQLHLSLRI